MHLFFLARGVKHKLSLFETFMQAQMWKWKRKDLKEKKDVLHQVQGALRPIQLYEYIFPEECLDEVLTALDLKGTHSQKWRLGKAKEAVLRKALGKEVKPIPDYTEVPTLKHIEKEAVAIYPIGIKKDERFENKVWGYEQELL